MNGLALLLAATAAAAPAPAHKPAPAAAPKAAAAAAAPAPKGAYYAHSRDELRLVDPKAHTTRLVMALPDRTTDIAIAADGTLYTCTDGSLYRVTPAERRLDLVGSFGATSGMNALGFGHDGALYGAGYDGGVYRVSTKTGEAARVATLPPGVESAGDLVKGPNGDLLVTTNEDGIGHDSLYAIDPIAGKARLVGVLSHDKVYGLSARRGTILAFTEAGEVLAMDPKTGATRLLYRVSFTFWGVVDRLP
jgi:hypothetical protein